MASRDRRETNLRGRGIRCVVIGNYCLIVSVEVESKIGVGLG